MTKRCDHVWSKWRNWNFQLDGGRWILDTPQIRECELCDLKQRERWWRR